MLHVVFEGGEDVHVVPRDAGEDGDVGVVVVELRAPVDGGGEVFVAFEDGYFAGVAEVYHGVETFEQGACHVVELDAAVFEDVHNHGGGGGFAVAPADDDAAFVFGLFVEVFGVAVYADAEFLGTQEFGVVLAGVHAEDDGVECRGDFLGKPSPRFGQKACLLQAGFGGFEYFVVGSGDVVSFFMEGECQVVHGGAADGNKMYVHNPWFNKFFGQR